MSDTSYDVLLRRKQEMHEILTNTIRDLAAEDGYLLQTCLFEEAISHRFAVYLERRIAADDVFRQHKLATDCEYDKFAWDWKSVPNTWDPDNMPERERDRRIRPDIIVHQSGNALGRINLLAVEIKKSSTVSTVTRDFALWKCRSYRSSNLAYMFAAYVCLRTGEHWRKDQFPLNELILFPE